MQGRRGHPATGRAHPLVEVALLPKLDPLQEEAPATGSETDRTAARISLICRPASPRNGDHLFLPTDPHPLFFIAYGHLKPKKESNLVEVGTVDTVDNRES